MSELLFSITAKDCRWDYFRGTGKGGQKRNKTSSGVRCTHADSGAVGQSDDTRSQHQNRRIAFERMAETSKFKAWHKVECARRMGEDQKVKDAVEAALRPWNLKEEVFDGENWVNIGSPSG
jgi:protein subunit release factor B